jgi:hypothetical protein
MRRITPGAGLGRRSPIEAPAKTEDEFAELVRPLSWAGWEAYVATEAAVKAAATA